MVHGVQDLYLQGVRMSHGGQCGHSNQGSMGKNEHLASKLGGLVCEGKEGILLQMATNAVLIQDTPSAQGTGLVGDNIPQISPGNSSNMN